MLLADFLAAKFALDERSLDPAVRIAMVRCLQAMPRIRCLDVGAGAGAMAQRLLDWMPRHAWCMTALDSDPELLAIARAAALRTLASLGRDPLGDADGVRSQDARIALHFVACAQEAYRPERAYDIVFAHAFLDLVALAPTLTRLAQWLRPGGYLYASINCDGEPSLWPSYSDASFESDLLACYRDSMERRRVDGQVTGGAYCGRRLCALLPGHAFTILAQAASDWHIEPWRGAYRNRDEICLDYLLDLICKEGRDATRFDAGELERWRADRMRLTRERTLVMRVPNRDVLAQYLPNAPTCAHAPLPPGDQVAPARGTR